MIDADDGGIPVPGVVASLGSKIDGETLSGLVVGFGSFEIGGSCPSFFGSKDGLSPVEGAELTAFIMNGPVLVIYSLFACTQAKTGKFPC